MEEQRACGPGRELEDSDDEGEEGDSDDDDDEEEGEEDDDEEDDSDSEAGRRLIRMVAESLSRSSGAALRDALAAAAAVRRGPNPRNERAPPNDGEYSG